ncbi:hypothetical protein LTS10_001187 [Elasticomyces elasticus]|nr:hypothetical protein LTS10_001187 [Elasticomyces elasticus]
MATRAVVESKRHLHDTPHYWWRYRPGSYRAALHRPCALLGAGVLFFRMGTRSPFVAGKPRREAELQQVSYAVSAMRSAVGENRLMPKPELDCILINASSGYSRANRSWVLSRMLRDFDHWGLHQSRQIEEQHLTKLQNENNAAWVRYREALSKGQKPAMPLDPNDVRIGLRVTVWVCKSATGQGSGDVIYWAGLSVSLAQLTIATVPWGLHGEWFAFMVTALGTLLAYASGAIPQWRIEKVGVRKLKYNNRVKERKNVLLTEGNGAHDVLLVLGCEGGMDLEALAAPQRQLPDPVSTRLYSIALALSWVALLITVSGWTQHTWYILAIGMIGMLHNVGVAGVKRQPSAHGIDLQYCQTVLGARVMDVLQLLEMQHPKSGSVLISTFFPGALRTREARWWTYAVRRYDDWKAHGSPLRPDGTAMAWTLPPSTRPDKHDDDNDIPAAGPYQANAATMTCPRIAV